MNICLKIFVLLVLVSAISCKSKTSKNKAFIKTLSGTAYKKQPPQTSVPTSFYNSLLALNYIDANTAIASRDHEGAIECPYVNYKCDPKFPWRKFDGTCNNLKFPWWGQSFSQYKRLLSPDYEEHGEPRALGVKGNTLENPRTIALKVHYPKDIFIEISNLFPVFGQFVNHDIIHSGDTLDQDGDILKCTCDEDDPPECINIPVPSIDYYNKEEKCLIQVRSRASYPEFNCYTPYREQINEATSWIDLSLVYGNTQEESDNLRAKEFGKLITSSFEGLRGDFLPTGCSGQLSKTDLCFNAGDGRVNQYPLLTSMHTLWLREHNRIADALWQLNQDWNDELLFQTARTIAIAEFQNIIYGSFLEILVGKQFSEIFDLDTEYNNYFMGYDELIFPNAANEYSSAAARYGHGLTTPYETLLNSRFYESKNYSLWDVMFNPQLLLEPNAFEGFVRGCAYQRANWFSPHLTDYLSNDLTHDMGPHNPSTGFSLPAWNINRGRDHGLPSYNYYRPLGGLKRAKKWEDLTYIPKKAIERLKQVYDSPDDIDLWTGGMSEYPLPDAVVGPTFAYILARGFRDWKYGDRWYFENGQDKDRRFQLYQLNELRKSSLARIICDNSNIKQITPNPLLLESKENPVVECKTLPFVDLGKWKDYGPAKKRRTKIL